MSSNSRIVTMLATLAWQSCAWAGLGGTIDSVAVDRRALHGSAPQSETRPQYSQHTMTTDGGTTVHEYATAQGTIFAVTWQGPMPPDLQQLFGAYYDQYRSAAADAAGAYPGSHRHLDVEKDNLVVRAVCRPRYYHGKAYVPSLMPAGVAIEDLP